MGHNIDLESLMGLPTEIKCPQCRRKIKSNFDEYDIDCGEPNARNGTMTLSTANVLSAAMISSSRSEL